MSDESSGVGDIERRWKSEAHEEGTRERAFDFRFHASRSVLKPACLQLEASGLAEVQKYARTLYFVMANTVYTRMETSILVKREDPLASAL